MLVLLLEFRLRIRGNVKGLNFLPSDVVFPLCSPEEFGSVDPVPKTVFLVLRVLITIVRQSETDGHLLHYHQRWHADGGVLQTQCAIN